MDTAQMNPVKLDVTITPSGDLHQDVQQIKRAEELGFDGVWVRETAHNPFYSLTIAAKETRDIRLGTQAALAFPRSPMVTAQIAWDLARQSGGRFNLGLGTDLREHIERRFSENWSDPAGRLREYVESLRAIWDSFQTDARLRYRGEHYQFRLMAPFFNPGPISHPAIPIHLAGDNPRIFQLAGEICQGLRAPALHTRAYLREVVAPTIETGLDAAGRERSDFVMTAPVSVISGTSISERRKASNALRKRIAHYASSPSFQRDVSQPGLGALADELSELSRDERRTDMKHAVTADVLEELAIMAEPGDVYAKIIERYAGIADRVSLEWIADNPALLEAVAGSRVKDL